MIGTLRRECFDHVVVLGKAHLPKTSRPGYCRAMVDTQIFSAGMRDHNIDGWIRLDSNPVKLVEISLNFDSGASIMAGANLSS